MSLQAEALPALQDDQAPQADHEAVCGLSISIGTSVQTGHFRKLIRRDFHKLDKSQEGLFPIACKFNIYGVNQA